MGLCVLWGIHGYGNGAFCVSPCNSYNGGCTLPTFHAGSNPYETFQGVFITPLVIVVAISQCDRHGPELCEQSSVHPGSIYIYITCNPSSMLYLVSLTCVMCHISSVCTYYLCLDVLLMSSHNCMCTAMHMTHRDL